MHRFVLNPLGRVFFLPNSKPLLLNFKRLCQDILDILEVLLGLRRNQVRARRRRDTCGQKQTQTKTINREISCRQGGLTVLHCQWDSALNSFVFLFVYCNASPSMMMMLMTASKSLHWIALQTFVSALHFKKFILEMKNLKDLFSDQSILWKTNPWWKIQITYKSHIEKF